MYTVNKATARVFVIVLALTTVLAFMPLTGWTSTVSAASAPGQTIWNSAAKTQTTITLKWKKVSKAKGYLVYQKKSGKYKKIDSTEKTSYKVTRLKANTTNSFIVKAYAMSGKTRIYGPKSAVKTVKTADKLIKSWYIGSSKSGKAYNGKNGSKSVKAKLYKSGKLALSGSGNTVVFSLGHRAPWTVGKYRTKVKSSTIGSNVKPTNMDYWYYKCSSLVKAPAFPLASKISSAARTKSGGTQTVTNVTSAQGTFGYCTKLIELPSLLDGLKDISNIASGCKRVTALPNVPGTVNNASGAFEGCTSASGTLVVECPNGTDVSNMLKNAGTDGTGITVVGNGGNAEAISQIKIANSDNSKIAVDTNRSVKDSWNIGAVTAGVYYNGNNGTTKVKATLYKDGELAITGSGDTVRFYLHNNETNPPWYSNRADIKSSTIGKGVAPTSMSYWYYGCANLTRAPTIPGSVMDMRYTFDGCTSLTAAPTIPGSVQYMAYTFDGCTSLKTAPTIPGSVKNMQYTFQGCKSLTAAPDMSNATSVTDMSGTFRDCKSLTAAPTIPGSVQYMVDTFLGCTSLTGTMLIKANPSVYVNCFNRASTGSNVKLTVNYMTSCTNIDSIIATKSENLNIVKGKGIIAVWDIGAAEKGVKYNGANGTDSVQATLYEDGLLDITGKGDTVVFGDGTSNTVKAPWTEDAYKGSVKKTAIGSEVAPTNMDYWYYGCSSLTEGPAVVPASVKSMVVAFRGCSALTGTMEIDAAIPDAAGNYTDCFFDASTNSDVQLYVYPDRANSNSSVISKIVKDTKTPDTSKITFVTWYIAPPALSVTVAQQSTTVLTATVTGGSGQYSYLWYCKYGSSDFKLAENGTSATLTIVTGQDSPTQCKCVVTDSSGNKAEATWTRPDNS